MTHSVPPAVQSVIKQLEEWGYIVRFRQQRTGSLRYSIGAGPEKTGHQLMLFCDRVFKQRCAA